MNYSVSVPKETNSRVLSTVSKFSLMIDIYVIKFLYLRCCLTSGVANVLLHLMSKKELMDANNYHNYLNFSNFVFTFSVLCYNLDWDIYIKKDDLIS